VARERLSRVAPALLLLVSASAILFGWSLGPTGTAAASASGPPRPGVAVLFVVDRVSFEELMAVREFQALARAGGAGLMTTKVGSGDPTRAAYLTIGAGAIAPDGGPPFLVNEVLEGHRVGSCLYELQANPASAPGPEGLLAGAEPRPCIGTGGPHEIDLLSPSNLVVATDGETFRLDERRSLMDSRVLATARRADLADEGTALRQVLGYLGRDWTLAMVVTPTASTTMDRIGDEVTPLVMAEGRADQLLRGPGAMHALTSDTTRFDGMVSNVDVAPTILRFFGIEMPSQMDGEPIRATDAAAPFALHRRHLEQRRIRLPVQLGALAFVVVVGALAIALLIGMGVRGSLLGPVADPMRFLAPCATALPISMLAGGLLPRLTYAWVVPFLVVTTIVLAWLALIVPGRGPLGPLTFLGAVGAGFLILDMALGGRALRIPLLGGTMFDGVRYYGLPNAFIALLLASALFLAHRLRPYEGFVLLIAAALFAGFPSLGADIGGAVTLFAAAGAWWVLRTRPRIGTREVAFGVGVVAVGLGAVLLANRYFPGAPTHATRFVEGGGFGGAWRELRHRLGVGWGQIRAVPASWIPLIGLPMVLGVVLAGPGPIRRTLELEAGWRDVIIALVLASIVAYVANDTGVAAAAPGFLYAMAAVAFPAFTISVAERGRERSRATPSLTLGERP
jgi:hypothetical protein